MVINNYLPFIGGSEIQAHKLSKQLVSNGHTVDVLTSKSMNKDLKSLELLNNVKIIRVPSPYIKIANYGVGQSFFTFCNFLYFLIKYSSIYDLIHVHQALRPALAVAIAGKLLQIPTVCKIGNGGRLFDLDRYEKIYFEGIIGRKIILKNINIFVSISQEIKKILIKNKCADKLISIPNGVEVCNGIITRTSKKSQNKTNIITVGSLTTKKNYYFIISALATLDNSVRKKIQLLILGDGPERAPLQKQAKDLDMDNTISFIGNVGNVKHYMSSSNLFILASKAEGMSNALLEAMSCGLPCICSDVGSNKKLVVGTSTHSSIKKNEFIKGSCGYIFTPDSPTGFLGALKSFLKLDSKQKKKLSENAINLSKSYDIKFIAQKYEKLYNKLLI